MAKNRLTDREVRNAKCPPGKPFQRFPDGEKLYLTVFPSGAKSFQFRYEQSNGKETIATLKGIGGLAEARDEADRLRKIIAAGDDPQVLKHIERVARVAANEQTFRLTADAWLIDEGHRQKWTGSHAKEVEALIRNHLAKLDSIPITQIVARMTTPILKNLEKKVPGLAPRVARILYVIMDYAVEEDLMERNPLPLRRNANHKKKRFAAVTNLVPDPKKGIHTSVGDILRAFDKLTDVHESARRAHLLLVFTAQRISEVVNARWKEFDLEDGNWTIPRERMKQKEEERGTHIVPLPPVLLAQLRAWHEADGVRAVYVCPAIHKKIALPVEGIAKVYRDKLKLTKTHSPHSWRSVFKTVCEEAEKKYEVSEAQLDHIVGTKVGGIYDRSNRLEPRRELMTWYEGTIIAARDGATVLPLKKQG
jgi:integrase